MLNDSFILIVPKLSVRSEHEDKLEFFSFYSLDFTLLSLNGCRNKLYE